MKTIDRKILAELAKNSRSPNIEIAKKLKISEGTVRNRIQRLVKDGVIRRFTIERGTKEGFLAVVLIKTKPQIQTAAIAARIKGMKGVKRVYETAGEHDVIVEVTSSSAEDFNSVIERIRAMRGILETVSLTVLRIS